MQSLEALKRIRGLNDFPNTQIENQEKCFVHLSPGPLRYLFRALDETWEADHIKPFSLTGETNVHDMQATCRHAIEKRRQV